MDLLKLNIGIRIAALVFQENADLLRSSYTIISEDYKEYSYQGLDKI